VLEDGWHPPSARLFSVRRTHSAYQDRDRRGLGTSFEFSAGCRARSRAFTMLCRAIRSVSRRRPRPGDSVRSSQNHHRRTLGMGRKPLSSRNTRCAPRRAAFFCPRPFVSPTGLYRIRNCRRMTSPMRSSVHNSVEYPAAPAPRRSTAFNRSCCAVDQRHGRPGRAQRNNHPPRYNRFTSGSASSRWPGPSKRFLPSSST